jgi:hypothetical protein
VRFVVQGAHVSEAIGKPLTVNLSSTVDMRCIVLRCANASDDLLEVGMPHPENPYEIELRDSSGKLIEPGWGVFAPPGPLWIATLKPGSASYAIFPLSHIYRRYSNAVPVDARMTPAIDGSYTISFHVLWLDSFGNQHSLPVAGCVNIRLIDDGVGLQRIPDAVSNYPSWSSEDLHRRRRTAY